MKEEIVVVFCVWGIEGNGRVLSRWSWFKLPFPLLLTRCDSMFGAGCATCLGCGCA